MKLHIISKTSHVQVQVILQDDGWSVRPAPDRVLLAEHAEVHDEQSARYRLLRIGLLTSTAVQIDFLDEPRKPK
jgi:hypothetical protein